jgi:hypothetical protein
MRIKIEYKINIIKYWGKIKKKSKLKKKQLNKWGQKLNKKTK